MTARRLALVLLFAALSACGSDEPKPSFPGTFVIGFDGMQPELLEAEMAAGNLPNFSRLAAEGDYTPLGTSLPPESPVAWADFITGMDAGGHGIFDFIHREVTESGIRLRYAAARSRGPSRFVSIPFTGYHIPRDPGGTELLVRGKYFWEYLTERGIPVSIVRAPSNYPPKEVGARTFSGLGTPDVQGSYGVFAYYTEETPVNASEMAGTAHVFPARPDANGIVRAELRGPRNTFKKMESARLAPPYSTVPLTVYLDAEREVARLDVGDETLLLEKGEWSDWVGVSFPMIPALASASGIVRFYLKSVSPFALYASPVNVDPRSPDLPISTPPEAAPELAAAIGPYYTQGMAEDTQANRYDVLDTDEYLEQADIVLAERKRMLDHELDRFAKVGGLTFFYVSTTDLNAHMLWQYMDPKHPLYDPAKAKVYGRRLADLYRRMDGWVGEVRKRLPEGTRLVILSDHGFKSYRRQLSVNTWLLENGYLALKYPDRQGELSAYRNVDWFETKAYGVGFCGIYLNLRGREKLGYVEPGGEAEALKREIVEKLEALRDEDGTPVVTKVYRREEVYHGPEVENAPDLIVGYNNGYGCSDESVKGSVPRELLKDTDDAWSGNHLMDPSHVPGILLANRKFRKRSPRLYDVPAAILADFGIEPEGMRGRPIW